MKRSERYYQESRRQLLLAVAFITASTAFLILLNQISFPWWIPCTLLGFPLGYGSVLFTMQSLETHRLAKQSEQAEINRAIRPRL